MGKAESGRLWWRLRMRFRAKMVCDLRFTGGIAGLGAGFNLSYVYEEMQEINPQIINPKP